MLTLADCLVALGVFLVFAILVYLSSKTCGGCTRKIMPWKQKESGCNFALTEMVHYHKACYPPYFLSKRQSGR